MIGSVIYIVLYYFPPFVDKVIESQRNGQLDQGHTTSQRPGGTGEGRSRAGLGLVAGPGRYRLSRADSMHLLPAPHPIASGG